jgi:PAS domain S-box-containing protein
MSHREMIEKEKKPLDTDAKFRSIYKNSPLGILFAENGSILTDVNQGVCRLLGFSRDELIGKKIPDFVHPEDRAKTNKGFLRLVTKLTPAFALEVRVLNKNGEYIWVNLNITLLYDNTGMPTHGIGIIEDITERKQAEIALHESEFKYRSLVESSPDGIISISKTGQILSINESFCKLTGFEKSDFIGNSFHKVPTLIPQELDFYARMLKDIIQRKTKGTIEFKWIHANGEIRKGEAKVSLLMVNDNIVGIQAIVRDITERAQSEEIIKRRLDELLILQEVSSICLENMDENQIIAQVTKTIGNELYLDHFGVMLLDEEDNALRIHPSYQGLESEDADYKIKLGEGVVGQVAKTNKPLRINDVAEEENYISPKFCQSSELCVPISVNSKVFGVINAESSQKDAFSPSDERLLNTVADQLAVALQKSRLYQSEQKRRLEAEANREASEFLTMSLDLDDVLDNILDSLRKVIDSDQASIHLFEEDHIRIVAGRGFKNLDEVIGYKYSFENQLVVEIVNSSIPLVLEDTLQDSRYQDLGLVIIRGWMGIPLIEQGTVFGYISVDSNMPGAFSQRDAELVQIFANNAAAAIVKARLFEGEKKRRLEAEIQQEISTTLMDTLDLQVVFEKVLSNLQRYLDYDSAGILLEENRHLRIVATHGFTDVGKINNLCVSKDHQLYQEILKTKSALILENAEQDDRFEDFGAEEDIRGWMGVPLIDQGTVYGYMSFDSKTPGKFTTEMGRLAQVMVNQTSAVITKAKLFDETQLALNRLEALHDIDRIITSSVDLSFTIKQIMQVVVSQLEIDAASVLIYDKNNLRFTPISSVGFKNVLPNQHQLFGNGLASKVALERKILRIENQDDIKNQFGSDSEYTRVGYCTYVGIPLIAKGEIKGVLEIFHRSPLQTNNEWEGFLGTLATQLAIAIDNSQMFENLQKSHMELTLSYDATIEGWAQALEMRDMQTEGHSRRVVNLTQDLARTMGIDGKELVHLRRGALLHDIGKMGVPDVILQKPGKLTDEEWEIMRQHPTHAMDWLSSIDYLGPALDIPYCHHEKWDGSGYPQGLKGDEIPISARIFAIIDVYDALRSDRLYRKAWSRKKTIQHIQDQSEKHFDPSVVEKFLEMLKNDEIK